MLTINPDPVKLLPIWDKQVPQLRAESKSHTACTRRKVNLKKQFKGWHIHRAHLSQANQS